MNDLLDQALTSRRLRAQRRIADRVSRVAIGPGTRSAARTVMGSYVTRTLHVADWHRPISIDALRFDSSAARPAERPMRSTTEPSRLIPRRHDGVANDRPAMVSEDRVEETNRADSTTRSDTLGRSPVSSKRSSRTADLGSISTRYRVCSRSLTSVGVIDAIVALTSMATARAGPVANRTLSHAFALRPAGGSAYDPLATKSGPSAMGWEEVN